MGGRGVSRDPEFVLRNIWTAPKKVRPQQHGLSNIQQLSSVHMIESMFYWIGNPLAEMLILDDQNLKSLQI